MKAIWEKTILAESDKTVVIDGNHYFPPDSISKQYFQQSSHQSTCPWKGEASYYNVIVDGDVNENSVWYYPDPKEAAKEIKDHVAFWKGIEVIE